MKTIKTKSLDGKTVEMQVTDEQYESFREVQKPYWREKKYQSRHGLSLELLLDDNSLDIVDESQNPEIFFINEVDKKEKAVLLKILKKGLKMLTEKQADAIYMHFFLEMSYEEIAEDEGVSKVAIFKRIEFALKKLKKLF